MAARIDAILMAWMAPHPLRRHRQLPRNCELAGSFTTDADDTELRARNSGNTGGSRTMSHRQASTSRMTVSMLKASRSSSALLSIKSRSNRIVPVNRLVR